MNRTKLFIGLRLLLVVLFVSNFTSACEGGDLTRSNAERLVSASPQFVEPVFFSLVTSYEKEPLWINKSGNDEKREDAAKRSRETFLAFQPQIAAAEFLGLIVIEQSYVREEPSFGTQIPARWYFGYKVRANEKGKSMWKQMNVSEREDALPLAKREFVQINELTILAENQRAADFNWRWKANAFALAFEENSAEFNALPENIRKGLLGQTEANLQPQTDDWSGERKSRAFFQRIDTGWKLERFMSGIY